MVSDNSILQVLTEGLGPIVAMYAVRSELLRAVEWLQDSTVVERHYQAAMLIRVAVLDYERRKAAQELDVVQALVPKLEYGAEHPVTLVAVEGLACLVADNPKSRVSLPSSVARS